MGNVPHIPDATLVRLSGIAACEFTAVGTTIGARDGEVVLLLQLLPVLPIGQPDPLLAIFLDDAIRLHADLGRFIQNLQQQRQQEGT
jgi:hypothetical protein